MKIAVVLMNLGGPDSLDSVEPFLKNLFSDPDIFKIPFGQKWFANWISRKRTPFVQKQYDQIGGSSPINFWTEQQRILLQHSLREIYQSVDVYTAMRYWNPLTEEVARTIASHDYQKVILMPLYPQYCLATTGSSFNEWERVFQKSIEIIKVVSFYTEEKYLKAMTERINEGLRKFSKNIQNEVVLLFSAHGIPVSYVKKGDPYKDQILQTVQLIMESGQFQNFHELSFQSKVGPVKWLQPATDEMIKQLIDKGKKYILVIPISFVSDHIETLFEVDIEYRHLAENLGVFQYECMTGLNDSPYLIQSLTNVIKPYLL